MQTLDRRSETPGPNLELEAAPKPAVPTLTKAVKSSIPIVVGQSRGRDVVLVSGGCKLDPDTMNWEDCPDGECVYKNPFGGSYLKLLAERAVAIEQLKDILHHALDNVRKVDGTQK